MTLISSPAKSMPRRSRRSSASAQFHGGHCLLSASLKSRQNRQKATTAPNKVLSILKAVVNAVLDTATLQSLWTGRRNYFSREAVLKNRSRRLRKKLRRFQTPARTRDRLCGSANYLGSDGISGQRVMRFAAVPAAVRRSSRILQLHVNTPCSSLPIRVSTSRAATSVEVNSSGLAPPSAELGASSQCLACPTSPLNSSTTISKDACPTQQTIRFGGT